MSLRRYILAVLLYCFAADPLFAQADTCSKFNAIEQLEAGYTITNGPGQVINVPRVGIIPGPETATSVARLEVNGDGLLLITNVFGTMDVTFTVVDDANENWHFAQNDTFGSASSEDISIVAGCDQPALLMRLLGTGTTELPNVGVRPVTIRMIVFPNGYLIGRMAVVMVDPDMTLQTRLEMKIVE